MVLMNKNITPKRKKVYIVISVILILVLLVPIPSASDGGGSRLFDAITYSVNLVRDLWEDGDYYGILVGTQVRVLGITVFDNTRFEKHGVIAGRDSPIVFSSGEIEYIPIPVSPALDMELLLEHGGPWIVRNHQTGEPFFVHADNVFKAEDGTGMFFATVPEGSGIISTSIQGYDPATETMYVLNERGLYDYRFFMYENELFVAKWPHWVLSGRSAESQQLIGIFRPILNRENQSFDLVSVDDELSALIQQPRQEEYMAEDEYHELYSDDVYDDLTILMHHSPTDDNLSDEWVTISFWIDETISISIPYTWYAYEYIYFDHTPDSFLRISGKGTDGHIEMIVTESPIGDPDVIVNEAIQYECFQFDDGHIGYMLEWETAISWIHLNPGMISITVHHGGNRDIFTDNEEMILSIVRSLS